LLRQKRESLNLTQQQVADKLRLRINIIQSIEDNNFNIDKVKTFTRGYVRSYSRVLGLDEQTILASYDTFCGVEPQEIDMKSFSKRTKKDAHDSRLNYITFGVILIVIGISSVWWFQNQSNSPLIEESSQSIIDTTENVEKPSEEFATVSDLIQEPSSETLASDDGSEVVVASEEEVEQTQNPEEIVSETPADTIIEESDTLNDSTGSEESIAPQTSLDQPQESNPTSIDPMITMTFIDECWIQVKDSTGKTLSVGTKKPGQVVSLDGQPPFSVILGAPESVSMTFASEPVDLSGYTSGKVARFTLPR
jgi:cytoskeleton protein RodZ